MEELQYYDTPSRRSARKSRKWIILLFVLLLLLIGGGIGAYTFLPSLTHKTPKPTMAPTPTDYIFPTDSPTPSGGASVSPSASVKESPSPTAKVTGKVTPTTAATPTTATAVTIAVENGSGAFGVAAKMKTYLTGLGYTVSSTGNADNFNYKGVTIEIKKSKASALPKLKSDIAGSYTVSDTSTTLPETSATDAVVIVGQ